MYNSNTDLLGLILDVEVFFSEGHCSGALCQAFGRVSKMMGTCLDNDLLHNLFAIIPRLCDKAENADGEWRNG